MTPELEQIHARIEALKSATDELAVLGENMPAVACNTARIRASVQMLMLNISDLLLPLDESAPE